MTELPKIIPVGQMPRRNFIKGAALMAVAATGCTSKDPFSSAAKNEAVQPSGETVQLLSTSGEIIEVDKAFLKPLEEIPSGKPGKLSINMSDSPFRDPASQ